MAYDAALPPPAKIDPVQSDRWKRARRLGRGAWGLMTYGVLMHHMDLVGAKESDRHASSQAVDGVYSDRWGWIVGQVGVALSTYHKITAELTLHQCLHCGLLGCGKGLLRYKPGFPAYFNPPAPENCSTCGWPLRPPLLERTRTFDHRGANATSEYSLNWDAIDRNLDWYVEQLEKKRAPLLAAAGVPPLLRRTDKGLSATRTGLVRDTDKGACPPGGQGLSATRTHVVAGTSERKTAPSSEAKQNLPEGGRWLSRPGPIEQIRSALQELSQESIARTDSLPAQMLAVAEKLVGENLAVSVLQCWMQDKDQEKRRQGDPIQRAPAFFRSVIGTDLLVWVQANRAKLEVMEVEIGRAAAPPEPVPIREGTPLETCPRCGQRTLVRVGAETFCTGRCDVGGANIRQALAATAARRAL